MDPIREATQNYAIYRGPKIRKTYIKYRRTMTRRYTHKHVFYMYDLCLAPKYGQIKML